MQKNKLKILYVANARMPTEKAHGVQIAKMSEMFASKGHEVSLIVPRRLNPIKEDVYEYYGVEKNFRLIRIPTIDLITPGFGKYAAYLNMAIFDFLTIMYVLFRPGTVTYTRHLELAYVLSLFGKKAVFEDHEPYVGHRALYEKMVKRVKRKVVVARHIVELYQSYGVPEEEYAVAPNGVEVEPFANAKRDVSIWEGILPYDDDTKVVFYAGHFYRWKGVYTLIDAAKKLPDSMKVVLIGGTDEDRELVQNYIKEKEVTNVYVHPFVKHEKIPAFMAASDALALPNTAKEERSSKYTTPIKLFEYLASGVPIVASDIQSFEGFLTDRENAVLAEADNPDDLARAMRYTLEHPEEAKRIGAKAQQDSKNYTWAKRADIILEYVKK